MRLVGPIVVTDLFEPLLDRLLQILYQLDEVLASTLFKTVAIIA